MIFAEHTDDEGKNLWRMVVKNNRSSVSEQRAPTLFVLNDGYGFVFHRKNHIVDIHAFNVQKFKVIHKVTLPIRDFNDVQATTQRNNFYLVIANRNCFLFRLDELIDSKEEEVNYREFSLPQDIQFEKPYEKGVSACILGNQLFVVSMKPGKGLRMHSCNVNTVLAEERRHMPVQWRKFTLSDSIENVEKFDCFELVSVKTSSLRFLRYKGSHSKKNSPPFC